jgi:hypothetical protein
MQPTRTYEVRPRKDKRGFDLISDALPFGRLWFIASSAYGSRTRAPALRGLCPNH